MSIEIIKTGERYVVYEDGKVHASYSFSPLSAVSRMLAMTKAQGFKEGLLYARQEPIKS